MFPTKTVKYLTANQAALQLNCSRRTMERLIERGEFPHRFKTSANGHWRIPESDIVAYIKKNQPQPA